MGQPNQSIYHIAFTAVFPLQIKGGGECSVHAHAFQGIVYNELGDVVPSKYQNIKTLQYQGNWSNAVVWIHEI